MVQFWALPRFTADEVDVSYYHAVAGTNFVTICCIQTDVDLYKIAVSKADVTEATWGQQGDETQK